MFHSQPPFGLDISDLSLKLVSLRKKGKQIQLVSFNQINVPEGYFISGEIKEQKKIVELIKKLIKTSQGKKIKTPYIISVLPEAKTFIKLIEVPNNNKNNEISPQAIEEELRHHIPFSLEEIYYDWQKIAPRADKMKILATAALKKLTEEYSLLLKDAGLKPLVFEPEPAAICRALLKEKYSEEGVIIFDLGATRSSITVFDRGTIQFAMSIPISGQKITQSISEKLKITYQEAEKMKFACGFEEKKSNGVLKEILSSVTEELIKKIEEARSFYKEERLLPNHRKITKVLLCGGGANFKGIERVLSQKINLKVEKGDPLWQIALPKNLSLPLSEALTYATAIGLGLRGIQENF